MNPARSPAWRLAIAVAGLWLAWAAPACAALRLLSQDATLASAQAVRARQLLDDATMRLPPVWRDALDEVTVEWRGDLPRHVAGRMQARRLLLDRRLLEVAAPNADDMPSLALRTLIHELAHLYDRSVRGGLSHDPRLLDLAGWQVRPLRLGLRGGNAMRDRSPDAYELHSPVEFVAVNLEYFVLDPDYACRRPQLHAYFAGRLGTRAKPACAAEMPLLAAGQGQAELLRLDPERVYAIDYLLAEGNEQPMSRWGHGMLRLVVCAPGRALGPECRLDLVHHHVLSFRAFVDDVQISGWRGLTGAYPSRLFVLPLAQVIEDYTEVELRGLQSIPLRLRRDEISGVLQRAAQLHWSYDGRYYFLGNNCAVEAWKLLHDGAPRLAAMPLSAITPNGLLRKLRKAGVADAGVLEDGGEARRLGYYFEPASARYQAMFDVVRGTLPVPQASVQAWLALSPEKRAPWLEQADLRTSAALLLLEESARRRQELVARDALKRVLLGHRGKRPLPEDLRDVLDDEGLWGRPAALLEESGYGLPQAGEQARLAVALQGRGERVAAGWQALREQAIAALPPGQRQRMRGIEANLAGIGDRLRRLHRESGGLSLP